MLTLRRIISLILVLFVCFEIGKELKANPLCPNLIRQYERANVASSGSHFLDRTLGWLGARTRGPILKQAQLVEYLLRAPGPFILPMELGNYALGGANYPDHFLAKLNSKFYVFKRSRKTILNTAKDEMEPIPSFVLTDWMSMDLDSTATNRSVDMPDEWREQTSHFVFEGTDAFSISTKTGENKYWVSPASNVWTMEEIDATPEALQAFIQSSVVEPSIERDSRLLAAALQDDDRMPGFEFTPSPYLQVFVYNVDPHYLRLWISHYRRYDSTMYQIVPVDSMLATLQRPKQKIRMIKP